MCGLFSLVRNKSRAYGAYNAGSHDYEEAVYQRCMSCDTPYNNYSSIKNKRINNVVRVPSSLYTMNKASYAVSNQLLNAKSSTSSFNSKLQNNQSSDRWVNSNSKRYIPSKGNSLRSTKTSDRPGGSAPCGVGVDIKHNSYDRYLNKLKGQKHLRGESSNSNVNSKAIKNNKLKKESIISSSNSNCNKCS